MVSLPPASCRQQVIVACCAATAQPPIDHPPPCDTRLSEQEGSLQHSRLSRGHLGGGPGLQSLLVHAVAPKRLSMPSGPRTGCVATMSGVLTWVLALWLHGGCFGANLLVHCLVLTSRRPWADEQLATTVCSSQKGANVVLCSLWTCRWLGLTVGLDRIGCSGRGGLANLYGLLGWCCHIARLDMA